MKKPPPYREQRTLEECVFGTRPSYPSTSGTLRSRAPDALVAEGIATPSRRLGHLPTLTDLDRRPIQREPWRRR